MGIDGLAHMSIHGRDSLTSQGSGLICGRNNVLNRGWNQGFRRRAEEDVSQANRMLSSGNIKGCLPGSVMDAGIIGKFQLCEIKISIRLQIANIRTNHFLKSTNGSLRLTISLGVIRCR